MANNEIKPFATGANANVTPQAEWENLPALLTGFSSGKASSAQVNKAIRQASFVAATLAQFIADQSGEDVRDDGDQAGLVAKMLSAINKTSQPLDETLVALAALATGANKLPYFTGEDTAAVTDLTAIGREIIGKSSISEVLTYLTAAPLASPTFTGDPKAPTPAVGDNDTSIATTAFVSAAISALGGGSMLPVGVPVPWVTATPPTGWIAMMGQSISQETYPLLYSAYGSTLPDLRGYFIRGWDNGRGIDSGRVILSSQSDAIRNIVATYQATHNSVASATGGAFYLNGQTYGGTANTSVPAGGLIFDASRVVPTASDNRPYNIAFNYIVRAA